MFIFLQVAFLSLLLLVFVNEIIPLCRFNGIYAFKLFTHPAINVSITLATGQTFTFTFTFWSLPDSNTSSGGFLMTIDKLFSLTAPFVPSTILFLVVSTI